MSGNDLVRLLNDPKKVKKSVKKFYLIPILKLPDVKRRKSKNLSPEWIAENSNIRLPSIIASFGLVLKPFARYDIRR